MRLDALLPKRRAWLLCLLLPLTAGAGTPTDYAYRYTLDTAGNSAAWRLFSLVVKGSLAPEGAVAKIAVEPVARRAVRGVEG